jgi:hypothetical protein
MAATCDDIILNGFAHGGYILQDHERKAEPPGRHGPLVGGVNHAETFISGGHDDMQCRQVADSQLTGGAT